MKKIFTVAILVLLISNLNAQIIKEFGYINGLSISNIEWSNNFNPDRGNRYGISTFLYANFLNSKFFNITTNLGYLQNGCITHEKMTDTNGSIISDEMQINSLDLLQFSPQFDLHYKILFIKPSIKVGPVFEYLLFYNGIYEYYSSDDIKLFNTNLLFSGSIAYENNKFSVFFQLNKQIDFKPTIKTNNFSVKKHNMSFNIGIGVKI